VVTQPVKISADDVIKFGQRILTYGKDVDKAYVQLDIANITPGSSPEAAALKNEFTTRLQVWKDNYKVLRQTLTDVGNSLITLGYNSSNTEDFNTLTAEDVRGVIDAVASHYPDATKILPPEPGSNPYGPPPPQAPAPTK
jgi:hypothetical protein